MKRWNPIDTLIYLTVEYLFKKVKEKLGTSK